MRKGIIMAGGTGSRLHPSTLAVSKQLLPVYDKPMVYYPLTTLMLAGVREMLLISTPQDVPAFKQLLGDGSQWGIQLTYAVQERPAGIAEALLIAEGYLAGAPSVLVLGDNIFYGHEFALDLKAAAAKTSGATVFAYPVSDPQRYGVVEFDEAFRALSIEEKPARPKSRYAVAGLYFYDKHAPARAGGLAPSARGELEITDLNRAYLAAGELEVVVMGRGLAWLDTGTHESLLEAAMYIAAIEKRQGLKIACPEEIAFRMGYITAAQLAKLAAPLAHNAYGQYLMAIVNERIAPVSPQRGPRAARTGE